MLMSLFILNQNKTTSETLRQSGVKKIFYHAIGQLGIGILIIIIECSNERNLNKIDGLNFEFS